MTSGTPIDGGSSHTPWQASEGGFGREWLVRDQRGWQVACDLTERHARLIAAAPDMLELLKEIREDYRIQYSRDDSPEGMFVGTSVEKDIYAIDDVIEKAEGR